VGILDPFGIGRMVEGYQLGGDLPTPVRIAPMRRRSGDSPEMNVWLRGGKITPSTESAELEDLFSIERTRLRGYRFKRPLVIGGVVRLAGTEEVELPLILRRWISESVPTKAVISYNGIDRSLVIFYDCVAEDTFERVILDDVITGAVE
jgi:hypothetical protein